MKKTLPFLIFLIAFNSFAQITLEKTYNNSEVTRIKLENSGEKYYEIKFDTSELFLYNSDHTLWKTLLLPATKPHMLIPKPSAKVIHISENKINPDANIEVIFVFYNTNTNVKDCKVFSENGTTLLTITNVSDAYLNTISGLSDKLITTGTNETKVYSVPELSLENTYNYKNVYRTKLENSGEKYYVLDKENSTVKIFNANHSLWKTINPTKPINAIFTDVDFVSETKINPDTLLEIGFSYSETSNNLTTYTSKIVNENATELLTVANSKKLVLSSIDGLDDKLIAQLPVNNVQYDTNIYSLPSLSLEKAYSGQMTRVKLENSGEKYYTSYGPANNELKIYNSNHSVWKSIKLPTESAIEFDNINTVSSISESKINPDSLIEIVYTFSTGLLGLGSEYSSKIINENGEILAESGNYLLISEIIGLQNKIIGINHNFIYGSTGYVYSLGNLSTSNFSKNATVTLSPNPVVSFLNLSPISYPIIEATIYNLSGILVKKEIAQNITKINVSNLPMGLYIVNLTDLNNQKSYHKITVAH